MNIEIKAGKRTLAASTETGKGLRIPLTVLTSEREPLTKSFRPSNSGKVDKVNASMSFSAGIAEMVCLEVTGPEAALRKISAAVSKFKPVQALMTGVTPEGRKAWKIVTAGQEDISEGRVSRSKACFSPASGPALFVLDFDVKEYPQAIRDQIEAEGGLRAVMQAVFPALRGAACLETPSASSFVVNSKTGISTGLGGQHWYFVISNGRDTVDLAKRIAARLEAEGWCWGHVTKNGRVLIKTLIDTAATAPERIIYEAAPILEDGLSLGPEKKHELRPGGVLRLEDVAPLSDDEEQAQRTAIAEAKAAVADLAEETRRAYRQEQEAKLIARGLEPKEARRQIESVDAGELVGDFEIAFDDGTTATVKEILSEREKFNCKTCPDPIEPEYGGGRNIAILQLNDPPRIFSQAHGGQVFYLWDDEVARKFFDVVAETEALPAVSDTLNPLSAWREIDPASIPRVRFVYGTTYAAGYLTVTFAEPKVGKSLLALAECIDAVTGRGFLTGRQASPLRVLYYNAEDDQNTLNGRAIAVLQEHEIPQSEITGRLYLLSGAVEGRQLVLIKGDRNEIQEAAFQRLANFIRKENIQLAIFDPLQDLSQSPETNEAFRALGGRIRRLANDTGAAIGLIHHTRKPSAGVPLSLNDGRGGSALRGVARFNRLLSPMTEKDGLKAGVADFRHYFRIAEAESNLAPPSSDRNRWFEKTGVRIGNGAEYPTLRPWAWPDTFAGVTTEDACCIRAAVSSRVKAGEPPRSNVQAKDWVGYIVAEVLGLSAIEPADKSRIGAMLKGWYSEGVLKIERMPYGPKKKEADFVFPGPKTPSVDGEATE